MMHILSLSLRPSKLTIGGVFVLCFGPFGPVIVFQHGDPKLRVVNLFGVALSHQCIRMCQSYSFFLCCLFSCRIVKASRVPSLNKLCADWRGELLYASIIQLFLLP